MGIADTDAGYRALTQRVFGLAKTKPTITIGIHEDTGAEAHGDDVVTILQVAIWNEFGTEDAEGNPRIPARSFIREWYDAAEPQLRRDLAVLMRSVIAGQRSASDILELLGQRAVGQIQQRMADGIPPPNALATARAKGSSTPLIHRGILRSSVTYRVEGGK